MSALVARYLVGVRKLTAVKAYGEFPSVDKVSITAKENGAMQADYTIEVLNTVSAGGEKITWTGNHVKMEVQGGVSTITQLLAAAGGVTGTAWANLAAIAAGSTAVAAMSKRSIRQLSDTVLPNIPEALSLNFDEMFEGANRNPILIIKNLGDACSLSFEQSVDKFTGVKCKGDIRGLEFEALYTGVGPANNTIVIADTVLKGSETVTWTSTGVTIAVESGVSTIQDVLNATVSGTPWATIKGVYAVDQMTTVAALTSTPVSSLGHYVVGIAAGSKAIADISLGEKATQVVVLGVVPNSLKMYAAGTDSTELEVQLLVQY